MSPRWIALVWLWLSLACGGPSKPPEPDPAKLPTLRPTEDMPVELMVEQEVTIQWKTGSRQFQAVLQHRKSELTLVGLGPTGRPGFVVRYRTGLEIEVENRTGREFPFSPAHIIADIQRAFYPWSRAQSSQSPSPVGEGQRRATFDGVEVVETYRDGALEMRVFRPVDEPSAGVIRITYGPHPPGALVADSLTIDNQWLGYRIEIRTLKQQHL